MGILIQTPFNAERLQKQRAYMASYRERNRERLREYNRRWAANAYHLKKTEPGFMDRVRNNRKLYKERHPERLRAGTRAWYQRLKDQVFDLYGRRCAVCGFSDERALELDHVNGGGSDERRHIGTIKIFQMAIASYEAGKYQILCANCNRIKMWMKETRDRRDRQRRSERKN